MPFIFHPRATSAPSVASQPAAALAGPFVGHGWLSQQECHKWVVETIQNWWFIVGFTTEILQYSNDNDWLVVLTILKNISQWEGLSHILSKIKNVWNHQPDDDIENNNVNSNSSSSNSNSNSNSNNNNNSNNTNSNITTTTTTVARPSCRRPKHPSWRAAKANSPSQAQGSIQKSNEYCISSLIYIYIHVYSVWYAGFHKWGSKNGGFIMKNPSINFRGTPQFLETSMYKCVYISRSQSSRILVPKALAPSEWLDHFNVWKKKLSATLTFDHTP